jgi:hypothetical protein
VISRAAQDVDLFTNDQHGVERSLAGFGEIAAL